jgi:hypothetical protein
MSMGREEMAMAGWRERVLGLDGWVLAGCVAVGMDPLFW